MWRSKYKLISFTRDEGVLTVSLNRPEKLNAVNAQVHTELSWLWRDVAADDAVRAVVLTGTGDAFSAGGDLDWFKNMTPAALDTLFTEARTIVIDMLQVSQPIVAAVNGAATGLGATIALLSDIIYASEDAVIADTHVLAGIGAGDGGAIIWPWLCGMARAKEYLMTGDKISAQEAERIGLVNHVVAAGDLLSTAHKMAKRLAHGPRLAIRATKLPMNKILCDTANLVFDYSLALEKECFHSADHRECVNAFLEKRKPVLSRSGS